MFTTPMDDPGGRMLIKPQYVGWSSDDAVKHYLQRLTAKIPYFETMHEPELNFVKVRSSYFARSI